MSDPLWQELLERSRELTELNGAAALLSWDQETYMPPGAQAARGRQLSRLSTLVHGKFTSDEMGALLEKMAAAGYPEGSDEALSVERLRFDFERERRLPERLVRERSEAQSEAVATWQAAREADDFSAFRPKLERLLEIETERATLLRQDDQPLYDALHEGFERGSSAATIEAVFGPLREAVTGLLGRIQSEGRPVATDFLECDYDPQAQWDFGLEVLEAMGFDFQTGRQDRSAHPFTTSFHPTDVRITTRVYPRQMQTALFGTIHEGGHALYEQGIAPADHGRPLGASISLGIHESQSRMWENLVGRSLPFWRHFYPRLRERFPGPLASVALEDFYRAVNVVRPSLIRVEADEVTYSLHIILRFELEQALVAGELAPGDLPEAWNTRFREMFGIEVPSDRQGCLQDIHWAWGEFGYFPTYTLGNLYAAQFFEQARREVVGLEDSIARGELRPLTDWLREKVHHVGLRRLAGELCEDICGAPLDAAPFVGYLERKYSDIYGLEG